MEFHISKRKLSMDTCVRPCCVVQEDTISANALIKLVKFINPFPINHSCCAQNRLINRLTFKKTLRHELFYHCAILCPVYVHALPLSMVQRIVPFVFCMHACVLPLKTGIFQIWEKHTTLLPSSFPLTKPADTVNWLMQLLSWSMKCRCLVLAANPAGLCELKQAGNTSNAEAKWLTRFFKSCSFQAILREDPLFWAQGPPGVKIPAGPPWPKSWVRPCVWHGFLCCLAV